VSAYQIWSLIEYGTTGPFILLWGWLWEKRCVCDSERESENSPRQL
jgi:hypothetical protein